MGDHLQALRAAVLVAKDSVYCIGGEVTAPQLAVYYQDDAASRAAPRLTAAAKSSELEAHGDAKAIPGHSCGRVGRLPFPLQLSHGAGSLESVMQPLLDACSPASFGRAMETVYDPTYRTALRLDTGNFAVPWHPADSSILREVERVMVPHFPGGIRAELYKLNVYGPGGFFKSHVDTPRGATMFGSLVVVLPVPHTGGCLQVRHDGKTTSFDWGARAGIGSAVVDPRPDEGDVDMEMDTDETGSGTAAAAAAPSLYSLLTSPDMASLYKPDDSVAAVESDSLHLASLSLDEAPVPTVSVAARGGDVASAGAGTAKYESVESVTAGADVRASIASRTSTPVPAKSSSTPCLLHWAAFFSDCEHEVEAVTDGYRLTLTYNLHAAAIEDLPPFGEGAGKEAVGVLAEPLMREIRMRRQLPRPVAPDSVPQLLRAAFPASIPLFGALAEALHTPSFMRKGGVLVYFCQHAYPHTSAGLCESVPRMLKGTDAALAECCRALALPFSIKAILQYEFDVDAEQDEDMARHWALHAPAADSDDGSDSDASSDASEGEMPDTAAAYERRLRGAIYDCRFDARYLMALPSMGECIRGECGPDGETTFDFCVRELHAVPATAQSGKLMFINRPSVLQAAAAHPYYGNEASAEILYSSVALWIEVPPWKKRAGPREGAEASLPSFPIRHHSSVKDGVAVDAALDGVGLASGT